MSLRCKILGHKKQERKHFTGKPTDWSDCQLTKDESREKKLKVCQIFEM